MKLSSMPAKARFAADQAGAMQPCQALPPGACQPWRLPPTSSSQLSSSTASPRVRPGPAVQEWWAWARPWARAVAASRRAASPSASACSTGSSAAGWFWRSAGCHRATPAARRGGCSRPPPVASSADPGPARTANGPSPAAAWRLRTHAGIGGAASMPPC